ncbi:MAG: ABC transporter ATP-binding protein [Firmicutes bacterium]|jgi:ABC-2 type transport system ATP-binding protein|nr:ABC transporter ATP-binding protein [Bacillota bacterium]
MHGSAQAVVTERLTRVFRGKRDKNGQAKPFTALDQVDIEIGRGELFGILGPNGAGKTTLIKILSTLLAPTSGRAFVGGTDVMRDPYAVRRMINMVSGGEHSGYGILTVRENLWMFSQFYGVPTKAALSNIDTMMERLNFSQERDTKINKLSTGMRQKMNFIRGFVNDPEILFLDEPTLGLDVAAARDVRGYIKSWVSSGRGKTVLLTTHYMADAEELCDRIAIIDSGKILACDTPANLKRRVTRDSVLRIEIASHEDRSDEFRDLPGVKRLAAAHKPGTNTSELTMIIQDDSVLSLVVKTVSDIGSTILSLRKEEPSLEDVFLEVVGRRLTDDASPVNKP